MEQIVIKGIVDAITYRNKDNGYSVIKLNMNNETIVATGTMPFVSEGDAVTLHGSYVFHSVYGQQFKCELCEVSLPQTQTQILRYLSGGAIKGIGPATAAKIVEQFKEDTLDVLENSPKLLTTIKGISLEKALSISDQYKMQFGIRDIMLTLSKYHITPEEATDVFKTLGTKSIDIIKENPYCLCGEGINFSFERVDEIALNFQFDTNSIHRIAAGIEYVLKSNLNNGHTCLPHKKLTEVAANFLEVALEQVVETTEIMLDSFRLFSREFDGVLFVFLPEYAFAEEFISNRVKVISANNNSLYNITEQELLMVEKKLGIEFDPMQISAVNGAMDNNLFILTGGPGTGKTTTLNAIIEIFENRRMSMALAAPTGRAAKRMTELTGRNATTIHRLLEAEWEEKGRLGFSKNKTHQLDYDVIILDEMSMVDVSLFKAVLEATRLTTRIILVGDSDQLPSVGAGNVLNDLISSGMVPFVKLTKIFRQAEESSIVRISHDIINGIIPEQYERSNDFYFIKRADPYSSLSTVIELCTERLTNAYGYSNLEDIQVLCPSRKKECGTLNLNNILQDKLNPLKKDSPEIHFKGISFRVGDKVMHIKNDYDITWESDDGEIGAGIFNGDIGFITEIDPKNRLVKVKYDNKIASYYEEQVGLIELAYAVTVHKSQGCEFKCVVIPLSQTSPLLRYRNLLYTAITRAKDMIVLVGDSNIFEEMILNDRKTLRYTALKNMLTEY
ncbi:MAG: ATP-dependent RecD-like DNA helicase [Clostridia bacterium]|nr:ATP-dependent RecD-like DNA helicase [Clostridia bacterium]